MQCLINFLDLDELPQVRFHSLLQPKDNWKRDETSSLHVMIDVMILLIWEKIKKCRQEASHLSVS
jgi:hypothetical protein